MRPRDYAYEALAEVTASDPAVARGQLNAALRDIRKQTELDDSFLLSAEIHERAKMYRAVFPNSVLTPNALAKHWMRVYEEARPRKRFPNPPSLPVSKREQNLAEARNLMKKMGWS